MIDHLVYITKDLAATAQLIESALGVSFSPGGKHENRGTKNLLLKIGPEAYLELLATDLENKSVTAPRWMGIDLLQGNEAGRLSRWAWAVSGGEVPQSSSSKSLPIKPFQSGSRIKNDGTTLRWQLSDPGSSPLIDHIPFLIDWLGDQPPAQSLPDLGCRLSQLSVTGPQAEMLTLLKDPNHPIILGSSNESRLEATIVNSSGDKVILV